MTSHPLADLSVLDQFAARPFAPGYPADHLTFNSPTDNVEGAVAFVVGAATTSQTLAMYSLTHPALIAAFVAQVKAGLPSLAVLDSSEFASENEQRQLAPLLACRGMPNFRMSVGTAPDGSDISHWKVYVADASVIITGSFNWTESACRENNQCTVGIWPSDAALMTAQIEAAYAWQMAHETQPS